MGKFCSKEWQSDVYLHSHSHDSTAIFKRTPHKEANEYLSTLRWQMTQKGMIFFFQIMIFLKRKNKTVDLDSKDLAWGQSSLVVSWRLQAVHLSRLHLLIVHAKSLQFRTFHVLNPSSDSEKQPIVCATVPSAVPKLHKVYL